jgi:hypothetical protein
LLRRDDIDELAELAMQVSPTPLDMSNQGLGFVLGEYDDLAQTRVHAVRQREIDDSVFAAERRRGLGAMIRELLKTLTATARHDDSYRAAGELADNTADGPASHRRIR